MMFMLMPIRYAAAAMLLRCHAMPYAYYYAFIFRHKALLTRICCVIDTQAPLIHASLCYAAAAYAAAATLDDAAAMHAGAAITMLEAAIRC